VVPEAYIWVVPSQCWDAIASIWQAVWLHAGSRWAVAPCHAPFMPRSAFMPRSCLRLSTQSRCYMRILEGLSMALTV